MFVFNMSTILVYNFVDGRTQANHKAEVLQTGMRVQSNNFNSSRRFSVHFKLSRVRALPSNMSCTFWRAKVSSWKFFSELSSESTPIMLMSGKKPKATKKP